MQIKSKKSKNLRNVDQKLTDNEANLKNYEEKLQRKI